MREDEQTELKKSLSEIKEIIKTIAAFANTRGGKIYIGIEDDGKVIGWDGTGLDKLVNEIRNNIEPRIHPSIKIENIEDKEVLIIEVPEGKSKPYLAYGRIYKRVGNSTVKASRYDIQEIISQNLGLWKSVEQKWIAKIDEIDMKKVREFIITVKENHRLVNPGSEMEVLAKLGLTDKNNVNLAGILLFGKNPQKYIPYAAIHIVNEELRRDHRIEGTITEQIEETMHVLRNYFARFEKNVKREEHWEIPKSALREALVNAVIHRDYSIPSAIYVKITTKAVEVINPGKLLTPLTVEKLKREHPSILRNPLIARTLYYMGYVETWGTGTTEMTKICLQQGMKEPEFRVEDEFFHVVFQRHRKEIDELSTKILSLLQHKERRSKEIADKLGISERTARKYLSQLVKSGKIAKIGKGKSTRYRIKSG